MLSGSVASETFSLVLLTCDLYVKKLQSVTLDLDFVLAKATGNRKDFQVVENAEKMGAVQEHGEGKEAARPRRTPSSLQGPGFASGLTCEVLV